MEETSTRSDVCIEEHIHRGNIHIQEQPNKETYSVHIEKTTRRGQHIKGTSYGGDNTKKEHQTKGILYKRDIHVKRICIWKRHTHGKNIYMERTYIWREHTHGGDIHIEGKYIWRGYTDREGIHIKGIYIQRDIHMERLIHERTYTWKNIYIQEIYILYRLCRCLDHLFVQWPIYLMGQARLLNENQ